MCWNGTHTRHTLKTGKQPESFCTGLLSCGRQGPSESDGSITASRPILPQDQGLSLSYTHKQLHCPFCIVWTRPIAHHQPQGMTLSITREMLLTAQDDSPSHRLERFSESRRHVILSVMIIFNIRV